MITFYINTAPKYVDKPEIHRYGCRYLQQFQTEQLLGTFEKLDDVIEVAIASFVDVVVCDTCLGVTHLRK